MVRLVMVNAGVVGVGVGISQLQKKAWWWDHPGSRRNHGLNY